MFALYLSFFLSVESNWYLGDFTALFPNVNRVGKSALCNNLLFISLCLSNCLSVCLSVCVLKAFFLSVCLSVYPFLSVCLFVSSFLSQRGKKLISGRFHCSFFLTYLKFFSPNPITINQSINPSFNLKYYFLNQSINQSLSFNSEALSVCLSTAQLHNFMLYLMNWRNKK